MKAIRSIAVTLLVFFSVKVFTQAPVWQWATGATGTCALAAMCTDNSGNAYVTGHFLGQMVFGSDTLNDTLGPYQDIFIAKYNEAGNPLWARTGNGYADVSGVTADDDGSVYIVGDFYNGSIIFGGHVLVNPNPGQQVSNIFFVKYDLPGNVVWAQNLGGVNNDQASGVCTDAAGNVYVTGSFIGDSLVFGNVTLQHLGSNDAFIAKFTSSGVATWIRDMGSPFSVGSSGVCTDIYSNVFITGYFSGDYLLTGGINNAITSTYSNNVFVAKYDSTGNMRWTQYAGGNNGNGSAGISADASGNAYVTGFFSDTITFGSNTVTGSGLQDIFTAKYDSSGNALWARSSGGTYVDQPSGIVTSGNGDSYVTGYFQSDTFYFGNSYLLNTSGSQVTFVANYDAEGNAGWVTAPGGTSDNTGAAVSYSKGSVYVAGTFVGGDIIFGNDTLITSGNLFLAKTDTILSTDIAAVYVANDRITVYPNPSNGEFNFNRVTIGNSIEVYNIFGQRVFTNIVDRDNYHVNLAGTVHGIYFYRVDDENGICRGTGKVVIQ